MIEPKELNMFEVRSHWPEAEVHLRRAVSGCDPDGYMKNVQAAVFAGINTLWRIEEDEELSAYVVTNLYTVDGLNTVAQIHLMTASDMEKILPLMDYFTVWAKKHNADWIEVIGREGWKRMLKPYGFKHEYTSLLKRVVEEIH